MLLKQTSNYWIIIYKFSYYASAGNLYELIMVFYDNNAYILKMWDSLFIDDKVIIFFRLSHFFKNQICFQGECWISDLLKQASLIPE
jgi:hypothetical protein